MAEDRRQAGAGRGVTMRDVAERAGVGLATVSRVVNGTSAVTPELADKVREAARDLGYRHDATASSLRRADRRTDTVALVLEDVANPFSSALQRAITDAASERGVLVLSGSSDENPIRERDLVETFTARRADGLIVVPTGRADDALRAAQSFGTPLVAVDRMVELAGVDTVTVDNREGTAAAAERLRAAGHRRVAYFGDQPSIWTAGERLAGFFDVFPQTPAGPVCRGLTSVEQAEQTAREALAAPEPPTAFVSGQNLITIGIRRALQEAGLEHRIALVGFDDFPLADLLTPGVSVIAQDPAQLGREAASLLFARLDGYEGPARHTIVPTRYIARGSGEIPAPAG
ncbi:LacI family DNA-binding transcriptional regulator [Catenulispora rubra]|uniref:LacI family DNA-binding transcriptional regulator n=1 Tax=Catenulispora rubra TaxID=280293 RepID=UPI002B272431|nr:LacI family DNA-binding transcriptional regulator [Catenulispora rubra]